jgi:hypothetical protein
VRAYQHYHHLLAHNILFGALIVVASSIWIGARPADLSLVFLAFLAHLVGDYFGSGPGWGIRPYLPFSDHEYLCQYAWDLNSWQNFVITFVFAGAGLFIALRLRRTPLEFVHAGLERSVVDTLILRGKVVPCAECDGRANVNCHRCARPLCQRHVASWKRLALLCRECVARAGPPVAPVPGPGAP